MRCNRAGRMDTAPAFIALLTCGVWERLPAERPAISLGLICERADEDRDRSALLLALWSRYFHRFERAKRERAAKEERDSREKS